MTTAPAKTDAFRDWCDRWLSVVGKAFGVIIAFISIAGAIFACLIYIVHSEVSDLRSSTDTLKPVPAAINSLSDRVTRMEAHWEDLKIRNLSGRTDAKSLGAIKQALSEAQAANVKVNADVIQDAGTKLLDVSQKNQAVWDAALAFLDYRTFLNADLSPKPTPATGNSTYRSSVTIIPNPEHPEPHAAFQVLFAGGYAPPDKSARLESMDKPQPSGSEFAFFIVDGNVDTIVLDHMYMKHVILRNADIQYDGKRINLEDVYFVNCTFHSRFKQGTNTIFLGKKILASANVNMALIQKFPKSPIDTPLHSLN